MSEASRRLALLLRYISCHAILATCCCFSPLLRSIGQPKPAVTPAAFGKWETLGAGELSPDGKWLAYSIRRVNTDEELRVASLSGARKDTWRRSDYGPLFSDDSRFLAYASACPKPSRTN